MRTLVLILTLSLLWPGSAAAEPGPWSMVFFGARNTDDSLGKVVGGNVQFRNDYLLGFSLNRRIGSFERLLRFELEVQLVKHLELQDHWEGNGAFVLRWLPFFWDEHVDTSFAVGEGISVASEVPEVEESYGNGSRKALNYLFFEFDFFLPNHPRWGLVARLHHRSGVFGLYDGEYDAANAVGLGLKYKF